MAGVARRIGVFGGAFDPPHAAHLTLARLAIEQLQLDELRVIPTGFAWHKSRTLTAPQHRLAMARLAFADLPQVVLDAREITRTGPSYTIDTLNELQLTTPGCELFLIIGADQAQALTSWRSWQEVVKIATICVAFRACFMRAGAQFDAEKAFPQRFLHLPMPAMDISATAIRAAVLANQDVTPLVGEPVARYIADHHLYQTV